MIGFRRARPWMFGVTSVPFGVAAAFVGQAMPFLLRRVDVPVDTIARISALTLVPSAWQFLWAPLVDVGFRRRTWLVLMSVLGAAFLLAALSLPLPSGLDAFIVLTVAGSALTGMVSSCNGGMVAGTLEASEMGRASGWMNAGNLGGGALGASVTLWLASHASRNVTALAIVPMIVLPSLMALVVPEPERPRIGAAERFRAMARDVWSTVRSRRGWTGVLICISPVGTAVAINLFSGIAADYRASDGQVTWVNGIANGVLTSIGALAGGWICDRVDRRVAYLGAGVLTALVGICMMLAPLSPSTYVGGAMVYMLVTGLCYAAFSALVLEIIGGQGAVAASTQYTLFTAAGNFAIAYVTTLDGWGYKRWNGPRGLLGVDAGANLIGVAVLAIPLWLLLRPRRVREPLANAAPMAKAV